jgi:iron(III) transport system substrate-binding protein
VVLGTIGFLIGALSLALVSPAAAAEDWSARWKQVAAAAEKEGTLNVAAPSGALWRERLMDFKKAYPKIDIKITPFAGRDFYPRLIKERDVGMYLWDVRVGGAETQAYDLIRSGGLASIRDMLILPEVADESNWYGGFDHMFLDDAHKYMLSFAAYESPLAFYNAKFVKADDLHSFPDLLNPRWKGKIALADPRGGSTAVSMAIAYQKFGADFIRKLLVDQEPAVVKNPRQIMDWFVSGKYPIAMGIPNTSFLEYAKRGIAYDAGKVSGLDIWSVGVGALQIPEPRPHPNATIVFVNWLLTRATQAEIMKAVDLNSRRKDVPVVDPDRALDWSRIQDYACGQTEAFNPAMASFKKLAENILK